MPTAEDEATRLDTLQALFPSRPRADLRRYLSASRGDLDRAFRALDHGQEIVSASSDLPPKKRVRTRGTGALDAWVRPTPGARTSDVLVLDSSSDDGDSAPATAGVRKSAFDALRAQPAASSSSAPPPPPPPTPTHVNLPPLTLATPALVAHHTRGLVTLVENALPPELAARLFVRMVRESTGEGEGDGPWTKNKWYLVDREVESPHTSCFYREVPDKLDPSSGYDPAAFDEYWYNGAPRAARPFTAEQDEARQLVGEFVRTLLHGRERHPLEWDGDWTPNVAVANCYRGAKESVGFHSDVLQYLGPYPTIASLTLGVTRPFRLRPFLPSQPSTPGQPPREVRTLDIPLPHNSLLIMHAGCQEAYKHAVPPLGGGMDLFRLPRAALGALDAADRAAAQRGYRERINMTFRHYRPDFAPRTALSPPAYTGTPRCACGVPCTLRPDGRGRARASLGDAGGEMLFFWVCNAGAQNAGKGCATWRVLDMRREGRGEWYPGRQTRARTGDAAGIHEGTRAREPEELRGG
ncbi:hypothetical protein JCM3770_006254 [Rhodotorula araucariae]